MDRESDGPFTLVVALANPATVEQLLRTATDIAAARNGRIHAVSVVHKPASSPFLLFSDEHIQREYSGERSVILDRAVDAVDGRVPVTTELRVGSDVSDAIARVVDEQDADVLLLGWHERSRPVDVVLGRTVDPLLRRAPCNVLVERVGTTADGVDRILLPTVGGTHAAFAAETVRSIALANDASVTVLSIVRPGAPDRLREEAAADVTTTASLLESVPTVESVRESPDVAGAIVDAADEHDLVLLGATREGHVRPRTVGSVARRVGRETARPVIIARQARPVSRFGLPFEWLRRRRITAW